MSDRSQHVGKVAKAWAVKRLRGGMTLAAVASHAEVSRERIRQIVKMLGFVSGNDPQVRKRKNDAPYYACRPLQSITA